MMVWFFDSVSGWSSDQIPWYFGKIRHHSNTYIHFPRKSHFKIPPKLQHFCLTNRGGKINKRDLFIGSRNRPAFSRKHRFNSKNSSINYVIFRIKLIGGTPQDATEQSVRQAIITSRSRHDELTKVSWTSHFLPCRMTDSKEISLKTLETKLRISPHQTVVLSSQHSSFIS